MSYNSIEQEEIKIAEKVVSPTAQGVYDDCLCGSGKKYKWCCMKAEQARKKESFSLAKTNSQKPNRKQKRMIYSLQKKAQKIENVKTKNRNKYYSKLKNWLSNSIADGDDTNESDIVFKSVLKKLFKRDIKDDKEFDRLLYKTISQVKLEKLNTESKEMETKDEVLV